MIPSRRSLPWALLLASTWAAGVASAQVTVSVEAVGRDETDGSDVGWNSRYPTPSFDDEATRRGFPNAAWEGSHRLEPGRICLTVSNLRSPYPPMHTLSLGYRVRLSGAVFDDGLSERTIEMHRFSGTPAPLPIERCLTIRTSGGATATGPTVPVPSGIGPAGAGMSGPACHGLWGLGVQLGFAEHAATYDDSPAMLAQSLTYARDLAAQSGCLPTGEIEALRQRMASAPSSRPLFDSILALRQRYATIVQQQCACGPVTSAPAPQTTSPRDPFAASRWRGEVRIECDDSPFGTPTDDRSPIEIQTRRLSPTQIELSLSQAPGHLQRTIITTPPGAYAGSGHASEEDMERDVTISLRDGQLHFTEDSVSPSVSVHCRKTAVLAPAP